MSCATEESEAQQVKSDDFLVDPFLADIEAELLSSSFIGANPAKARGSLNAKFPQQWSQLCSLTLPPNGFSSQPWWNDKAARKTKWMENGLPSDLVVPTYYHTYVTTKSVYPEEEHRFDYDEGSESCTLVWDEAQTRHVPLDPNFEAAISAVLREQGRFVLKPIEGNRAEGVMLVVAAGLDHDSSTQRVLETEVRVRRHTSEARLAKQGEGEIFKFSEWLQTCVLENPHIKTGILLEPFVEWDNEVTCISLAGGKLIVIGSKGGGLVRSSFAQAATRGSHAPVDPIIVVSGRPPLVVSQGETVDERRARYQLTAGSGSSASPSSMLVRLRDASGRRLCDVIRDSARVVTEGISVTRVDFFVSYAAEEDTAGTSRVRINEVEHGFDAGLLPSWFGMQMTELISKAWVLLGASSEERASFVAAHAAR